MIRRWLIALLILMGIAGSGILASCARTDPALRVILIPADGGTESGTLSDYRPLFDAVGKVTHLSFDLKVAQSYSGAVEALCAGQADIAFLGPSTFIEARDRRCADFLAVAYRNRHSSYRAAIFVRKDSDIATPADLRGHSLALGDANSTSSFLYPVAMLLKAGVDPARDMKAIRILGSHAASLSALANGQVDAAALSVESYNRALRANLPGADQLRPLIISEEIPYPPLVVRHGLSQEVAARVGAALNGLAANPDIQREMIRGYGGAVVDGYTTGFPQKAFDQVSQLARLVGPERKEAILRRAAQGETAP